MTETPLISIVTPAYNAARFIDETIRSVIDQTYPHWEMLIVDDGSTDETHARISEWQKREPRIRVFQQQNLGPADARNCGVNHAGGRYICFLDSDDLWLPEKLKTQIEFMAATKCALSYSQYRAFKNDPSQHGRLVSVPERVTYRQLLSHNCIPTLTVMLDRQQVGQLKLINHGYDDLILWLTVLKRGLSAHGIQKDLARYRLVKGSVSSNKFRAASWVWKIYRNVEQLSLWDSIPLFTLYIYKTSIKHFRRGFLLG